jgi:hypothetical protein
MNGQDGLLSVLVIHDKEAPTFGRRVSLIPWLWALEYKPSYIYELEKQDL